MNSSFGTVDLVEIQDGLLDQADRPDLGYAQLDEPTNGRVGNAGSSGDLPHGVRAGADDLPKALGRGGDGVHGPDYNVRFFARSSVRLSVRATNRTLGYHSPMPRSFKDTMELLRDAFGSLEALESFLGNPVKSTLAAYARGEREPGPRLMKKMAAKLGCDREELSGYREWKPGFLDHLYGIAAEYRAKTRKAQEPRAPHQSVRSERVDSTRKILMPLHELTAAVSALLHSLEQEPAEVAEATETKTG